MSHKFITFPLPLPAGFGAAYEALTGEAPQENFPVNAGGTRLDDAQAAALRNHPDFGALLAIGDAPPPDFAPAAEPE